MAGVIDVTDRAARGGFGKATSAVDVMNAPPSIVCQRSAEGIRPVRRRRAPGEPRVAPRSPR